MNSNSVPAINFSSYFECVLQEDSHIRQAEFKVTIPSLFPAVDNKFEPTLNSQPLSSERNLNKNTQSSSSFVSNTTITARNHTDYYFQLKGDSMKEEMEYTDGITEEIEIVEGNSTDIKRHKHEIKKPMTLYNYIYKNLNNVIVPKGSKAYGFFINGTYDTTSFVVVRIEGAVPLDEKAVINYQK